MRYITIQSAGELLGMREDDIRQKIAGGHWLRGVQWRKAPDGRILIDIQEVRERMSQIEVYQDFKPLERAEQRRRICGVYFLIRRRKVVYVGQSADVTARVHQHSDKDFDSYSFRPVPQDFLLEVESFYINKYRPEYNVAQNGDANECDVPD